MNKSAFIRDEDQRRFKAGKPVEAALPIDLPEVRWVPENGELVAYPRVNCPVEPGDFVTIAKSPAFRMTPDSMSFSPEDSAAGAKAKVVELLGVTNHPAAGPMFFFKVQLHG